MGGLPGIALRFGLFAAASAAADVASLLRDAEHHIQRDEMAEAEPLLAGALKLDHANPQALYRLGYVHYRLRRLDEAKRSLEPLVKLVPPALNARYFLGLIALAEGKPKSAIAWLEPVAEARTSTFDAASKLAEAYAAASMPEKAAVTLAKAISETPWDAALYYRRGQLQSKLGRPELARESFETSRRLREASREDVEKLMLAARALGEGKVDEALAAGNAIANRASPDPNALTALGVIYGNSGRDGDALEAFGRAASLDPKLFQAHYNFGLALLKTNRPAEARSALSTAAALLPQSPEANLSLGIALVMGREYAGAAAPLERARNLDPANPRVGSLLATAYVRSGSAAKAVKLLREIAQAHSSEPAPGLLLVEALNAIGDEAGALEAARQAQKRFPDNLQAHMAAGQQLARTGRYGEARHAFEHVLRLDPNLAEAQLGVADTMQRAGEHAGAAGYFRNALRHPATALAARVGLARSLIALRLLEDAERLLEEGLVLHPTEAGLRVELSRVYARLGKDALAAEQTRAVEKLKAVPANQ